MRHSRFPHKAVILPKSSVSGFTRFEFDSPFLVNAGTSYAFYISVTGSCFMFTTPVNILTAGDGWVPLLTGPQLPVQTLITMIIALGFG